MLPRWRWYHFYFLLALFDLAVILASVGLYHQSHASFRVALTELSEVEGRQRWVRDTRVGLVELNAPGNDVFESRAPDRERRRFEAMRDRAETSLVRGAALGDDLGGLPQHYQGMLDAEARIFDHFDRIVGGDLSEQEERHGFAQASALMATMDRFQAHALRDLDRVEETLREEEEALLGAYESSLRHSTRIERAFFATVVVVLIGIFWYGRQLQHADERMMAQREQVRAERHARLAAIGEVCSTVAHGIRNPLAGISAAAQVACELAPEGPLAQSLADIVAESRRLAERAHRLLDFSSPLQPRLERCEVGEIVRPVARGLQAQAGEAGIAVIVKLESDALGVRADPHMLTEVLYELGTNALRSMRDGGELRLSAENEGPHVAIEVADTGTGIPLAVRPRLFELFFTTRPDGTGMGLATAKKLVELQGGRIALGATGRTGTVFRIELPRA